MKKTGVLSKREQLMEMEKGISSEALELQGIEMSAREFTKVIYRTGILTHGYALKDVENLSLSGLRRFYVSVVTA